MTLARIRVGPKTDIDGCEALIRAFNQSPTEIELTNNWPLDARPGGVAAGLQTLITWARRQVEPTLVTFASGQDYDVTIKHLAARAHGIVGAMMASRVVAADGTTDISRKIYGEIKSKVLDINKNRVTDLRRGQSILYFCVDHSSKAFIEPFYTAPDSKVKDATEFKYLIEDVAKEVSPSYFLEIRPIAASLGVVIHELFSNTHNHARADEENTTYRRSVRAVNFSQRALLKARNRSINLNLPDMEQYFNLVEPHTKSLGQTNFFEITVIDSGPGFAARAAGASIGPGMSLAEEMQFVRNCFLRNASTRLQAGAGFGLPRVMKALKERGGLIRLRTGRLSLMRGFDPAAPNRDEPLEPADTHLFDAASGGNTPTELGHAAGSAVTILVPVGIRIA